MRSFRCTQIKHYWVVYKENVRALKEEELANQEEEGSQEELVNIEEEMVSQDEKISHDEKMSQKDVDNQEIVVNIEKPILSIEAPKSVHSDHKPLEPLPITQVKTINSPNINIVRSEIDDKEIFTKVSSGPLIPSKPPAIKENTKPKLTLDRRLEKPPMPPSAKTRKSVEDPSRVLRNIEDIARKKPTLALKKTMSRKSEDDEISGWKNASDEYRGRAQTAPRRIRHKSPADSSLLKPTQAYISRTKLEEEEAKVAKKGKFIRGRRFQQETKSREIYKNEKKLSLIHI